MEGNNRSCLYDMLKILVPRRDRMLAGTNDFYTPIWRINRTLCGRFVGALESTDFVPFHLMRLNFVTDSWVNKTGFNLTVSTLCGGTLNGQYGYLSTDDVSHSVECEWLILVREGRTIQITFEMLNIADNSNCQYSYIQLRNGFRKTSPLLGGGKYCGRTIPVIPESASNSVRVKFFARRNLQAVSQPFLPLS